jgi:hypothetical protein
MSPNERMGFSPEHYPEPKPINSPDNSQIISNAPN